MSVPATRYDTVSENSAAFVVRDGSAGSCFFSIPIRSAQALLPGRAFRAVSTFPGRGLLGIAFLDQRDGSLEAHRQAAIMVAATPVPRFAWLGSAGGALAVARGRIPFHVVQHPVGNDAARTLGAETFGLPSSLHPIDVRYEPRRVQCEIVMHGRHVLTLSMPRGGAGAFEGATIESLSYIDGSPYRTRGSCAGAGLTEGGRRVEVLLGDHPLADRLRRLGLPKRPLKSLYLETFSARVDAPERLRVSPR